MLFNATSFLQLIVDQFKYTTWPEWLGVITGFICIYLAARENIWSWPVSIISVLAYAWVFFEARMYGDMALQFYFLFTAMYGWYYWVKKQDLQEKPIDTITTKGWILSFISVLVLSVLLGFFLDNYTNTDVPYEDGFCTAMSFVAQFLLTRKILQNWLLWIFVDICYIPLYLYKNFNLSAIFYAFLVAIALKGYLDWRKNYREQTN